MNESKGYTVNGVGAMVEQGTRALEALDKLAERRDDDYTVAEIRIYENTPIEALVWDEEGITFDTLVWDGEAWVKAS
jgi:hypothetical protein